jgi:predicted dehydrogenase
LQHGGAILDCIHEIDLALWYFGPGDLASSVTLPATTLGLETDGLAELLIRHDRGTLSSVHLNFVQRDYCRSCTIVGAAGTISWDFSSGRVRVFGLDGTERRAIAQPPSWEINQMYLDEMQAFLRDVEADRAPANGIAEARTTLEIALAARERRA